MENLTIDDPSNLSGMCHLIDANGIKTGFNMQELEARIKDIGCPVVERPIKISQALENDLNKLSSTPYPMSNEIDDLLRSLDEPAAQPSNAMPDSWHPPPQNFIDKNIQDPHLSYMTNEEKRQNVIGDVIDNMHEEHGAPVFSIEKEKEEDEKSRKLESISFLRDTLEDEGEDISRIPNVTTTNTLEEIEGVYRLLILKNDRKRCCGLAEDFILMGAHGMEWAFDGERNYLGYKPDMTDWHKSVAGKLRRMRHDTSNVVSKVMTKYNLGSGMRILLELIPSMFLYSRMRKSQHRDNLISDDEYSGALNKLRNYE